MHARFTTFFLLLAFSPVANAQNHAVEFDGVSGYGSTAGGAPIGGSTWEAWVYQEEHDPAATVPGWVVSWWGGWTGTAVAISGDGSMYGAFGYGADLPNEGNELLGPGGVTTGQWHHVAGVFGTECSPSCTIYYDGVPMGTALPGEYCPSSVIATTLAAYNGSLGWHGFFGGVIDEVRISYSQRYSGAFTPLTRFEPDSETWGLWHFDEGAGSTAADEIGGRDFSLTGGYAWVSVDSDLDCNGNGVGDSEDIASGYSTDCDLNGVPDECQPDCDADGVPDECQPDCDGDQVPDACEVDCDANGTADDCEIAADPDLDCDANGELDSCQIATNPSLDQNLNGILDSCECEITNYCLAANNSSGTPARIGALGSTSLGAADLVLTVAHAPAFQFGLFFYGAQPGLVFYGEGALCVQGPVFRLYPVVLSGATGEASLALDLSPYPLGSGPGAVGAFETWHFQYWFRDPTYGPSGFNFSDGIQVTFCP
jgi:hypothetical protein